MGKKQHLDFLDGLRGIAILAVLLYHVNILIPNRQPFFARWGWSGVDLFFVLSGYLITDILLKNRESPRYFRAFYGRRLVRIFPVYYAALLLGLYVFPVVARHYPVLRQAGFRRVSLHEQAWFWLNLSNLRSAFRPLAVPPLSHFWTLAIEEQFYLVWPFLMRVLNRRSAIVLCVCGLVAEPLLRVSPFVQHINARYTDFTYRFTLTHTDGMFAGALLALVLPLVAARVARWVLAGAFVLGLGGCVFVNQRPDLMLPVGFSCLVLMMAGGIGFLLVTPEGAASRSLSFRPLVRLGQRSYAFYVVHPPLVILVTVFVWTYLQRLLFYGPTAYIATVTVIATTVCWLIAEASWKLVEEPALKQRKRFPY